MNTKPRPYVHDLKCEPASFEALRRGQKHVELRKDDRGYEVNDRLTLREWDGQYTGRLIMAKVTHIIRADDILHGDMLAAGVVALSVRIYREPRSI